MVGRMDEWTDALTELKECNDASWIVDGLIDGWMDG